MKTERVFAALTLANALCCGFTVYQCVRCGNAAATADRERAEAVHRLEDVTRRLREQEIHQRPHLVWTVDGEPAGAIPPQSLPTTPRETDDAPQPDRAGM